MWIVHTNEVYSSSTPPYQDTDHWVEFQAPQGEQGPQGPEGPLVAGTEGQTLRHDGTTWVASSLLYNNGTSVGIGTTSPAPYKLNVNGGGVLINDGAGLSGSLKLSGHSYIGSADWGNLTLSAGVNSGSATMYLTTENAIRLTIAGNGNVGIGATAPQAPLHVNGNALVSGNAFVNGSISGQSASGYGDVLFVGNDSKLVDINVANTLAVYGMQNSAVATLRLGTGASDISGSGGNIGIGTTTPIEKLELGGTNSRLFLNSATSNHILFNTHGVAAPSMITRSAGTKLVLYPNVTTSTVDFALGIESSTMWLSIPSVNSTNAFKFYAGTTELMRIRGDGNVGIGTTAPGYKLHTVGDIYANGGWLRVSGNAGLYFESWGGGWYMADATWIRTYNNKNIYQNAGIMRTDGTFQVGDNGGTFSVANGGNFAYRSNVLFANTSGNVGIGTATPSGRLTIQAASTSTDNDILFSVKDKAGNNVFIVYPDAVQVIVPTDTKSSQRGAFVVTGRGATKAETNFVNLKKENYLIGHNVAPNITTGIRNAIMGYEAGNALTTGKNNVMFGYQAGNLITTGVENVMIGFEAGKNSTTGKYNVFIGNRSGGSTSSTGTDLGMNNTFVGYWSAGGNTTGYQNAFLGAWTGWFNTTGYRNTYIGAYAGSGNYTGAYNVFIGFNAGANEVGSNKLYIATSSGIPLIWGDFAGKRVVINGNSSNNIFNRTFFSNGSAGGTTAWSNDSDAKLKTDIQTIANPIEKVMGLRGVNFKWKDNREEGVRIGFIAQEAIGVLPEVVSDGETYSMQYAPITALLVEAIKEQQKQLNQKDKEILELKARLDAIEKFIKLHAE
jgi:hypothetical protein